MGILTKTVPLVKLDWNMLVRMIVFEVVATVDPLTLIPFNIAELVFTDKKSAAVTVEGYEILIFDPAGIM